MDASAWIMVIAAAGIFVAAYLKAPELAEQGLKSGLYLFVEILPRMISAFVLAGLIQALVPTDVITHWMGTESGFRGIFVGMLLGALTPGGPMMQFPIVASLYRSGVSIGPLVSYLTAWSLLGFQRLIMWEFPFLGLKVVIVRMVASLAFPIVAGWLSSYLWVKLAIEGR
jgi:uncharacterized membrane protein YraQ (UPF0718 family)